MNPLARTFIMIGKICGGLVILSSIMFITTPENDLLILGSVGGLMLAATTIWVGIGNRAALSRRAWQLTAWAALLVGFAVLQLRQWQSWGPNQDETASELLLPVAAVILAAIVAGAIVGAGIRFFRQWSSPDPSH